MAPNAGEGRGERPRVAILGGEDRAKAVIDWTWAGFTHERAARISVKPDELERSAV
ncbi:MAG TPA: hypothetical protein VLK36_04045 [Gaiellaceae bacterium]|nr:hypothetical protein [Gaiellaceae bacterium]